MLWAFLVSCGAEQARKQARLSFPDGRSIVADVVDTPEARETGLMFRTKLPEDYGMLFVFPGEDKLVFWMKNTWVSLDIVFIGADKRITRLHEKVKASTQATPEAEIARVGGVAAYVLELPAGASRRRGLKEEDRLDFDVDIPPR